MADNIVNVNDRLITIGNTNYNIMERFLELAKKYYNLEDMNLLKTGFFGYSNEVMSDIAKNDMWHRNFIYNEIFLNTAKLPNSIHNWAKLLDENINLAIPAKMAITFSLLKSDIITYSYPVQGSTNLREFIIDKENSFYVENYRFMLENSVRLVLNKVSGSEDYSITAQYIIDNESGRLSTLTTPYIKSYIETINGKKYVMLLLDIWQITKAEKVFTVYSQDLSDILFYEYEFKDQLAFFNVKYTYGNQEFLLPTYFNNTFTPSDEKYCFYAFPDKNMLQIYFSGLTGSFVPKYNSELKLEVFTTLGSNANFSYNKETPLTFKFKNVNIKVTSTVITAYSDSAGGKDILEDKDFKRLLINKLHTRDSLISEIDLELFFKEIINRESVYGSGLTFFKARDDIERRSFSAYLLMKDKFSQLIPTNTVDLVSSIAELAALPTPNIIRAGSIVKWDEVNSKYVLVDDSIEDVDQLIADGVFVYSIPFTINIKYDPFSRLSYILDIVNKNITTSFNYINPKVNYEYLISNFNIKRLDFFDPYYNFKLQLATNMESTLVEENIKIRVLLFDGNTPYGYFDLNKDDLSENENQYTFSLKTNYLYNSNDEITLISESGNTNYIKRLNLTGVPGYDGNYDLILETMGIAKYDIIPVNNLKENLSCIVTILIKDPAGTNGSRLYRDTSNNSNILSLIYNQADISDYSIVSVFESDDYVSLFKTLSSIMYSDIIVTPGTNAALVRKVPLVYSMYFNNEINYNSFYEVFDKYASIIRQNIQSLKENTRIDLRLYNTYGICKYSTIDKVNINFEFNIKLLDGKYSVELDTAIKSTILNLVESFNESEKGLITISSIFTELQNNFSEIEFVEFVGLNHFNANTNEIEFTPFNKQRIERIFLPPTTMNSDVLDKEQLINFVPEFINVPYNKDFRIVSDNVSVFNPDIKLNYLQNTQY